MTKTNVNKNIVRKRIFISIRRRVGGTDIECVIRTLLRNGIAKALSISDVLPTNVNAAIWNFNSPISASCCLLISSFQYRLRTLWCFIYENEKCNASLFKWYSGGTLFYVGSWLVNKLYRSFSLFQNPLGRCKISFETDGCEEIADPMK